MTVFKILGYALSIMCMLFLWGILITPALSGEASDDDFGCKVVGFDADGEVMCERVERHRVGLIPRQPHVKKRVRLIPRQRVCDKFLNQFVGIPLVDSGNPNAKTVCVTVDRVPVKTRVKVEK